MDQRRSQFRAARVVLIVWATIAATFGAGGLLSSRAEAQSAPTVSSIRVEGNQRVEAESVQSYMSIRPGEPFDPVEVDRSLKTLFATGLFSDVSMALEGSTLVVRVAENPIINRVVFEGNRRLNDDRLLEEVEVRPRAILTRAKVQADVQRLIEVYRRSGRFAAAIDPKVVELPQNRVDLIFEITEGPITNIGKISFIGNERFNDERLREIISTRQSRWWAFLRSADVYDPDRINYDQELLRRFYLSRGYADFKVVTANAELSPDNSTFFINFTVDEGEQYTFGAPSVQSALEDVEPATLESLITFKEGDVYNAETVDTTIDALTFFGGSLGYAFVDVRPRIERDRENRVITPTFIVREGPRVYVERINIQGNVRTLDRVIRRELRLVEGDAYNKVLLERSRARVRGLGYFKNVNIAEEPGTASDQTVVNVDVEEQSTGELQFGIGFSTSDSVIGDISIVERNLLGRGQYLRLRLSASGRRQQVDVRFTEPHFRDRNIAVGFDVFSIRTNFESESGFDTEAIGFGLRTGFPLSEYARINYTYNLRDETIEVSDIQCALGNISRTICDEEGSEVTSSVGYEYSLDRRNDPLAPTRGYTFTFAQELAGLGGSINFLKSEAAADYYRAIFGPKVVANIGIEGGYIENILEDDGVRTTDRFRKGGTSFRGFEFAGLGPRDTATDDALGGKIYAIGTAEVRFPLGLPDELGFQGGIFTQYGTVGLLDDNDLGDNADLSVVEDDLSMRLTVGISLYWTSPIGPIRFDFAEAIQKEDYDKTEAFRFGGSTRF